MNPEEYYLDIIKTAGTRKKQTLQKIQEICKDEANNKNPDFSLVHIADRLKKVDGISEQGLRNKNAKEYRNLILCWKVKYGDKKKKGSSSTKWDDILDEIKDPTLKAIVGMILSENTKLKKENDLYKHQTTFHIDMRSEIKGNSIIEKPFSLTETEINALKIAISNEFFEKQGWETDEHGRVKHGNQKIYEVGYVTAIKRILDEYNEFQ